MQRLEVSCCVTTPIRSVRRQRVKILSTFKLNTLYIIHSIHPDLLVIMALSTCL